MRPPVLAAVDVLIFAALFALLPRAVSAQTLGILHIRVTLADPALGHAPVAHHTLLISDNPSSAPPRVVITAADGTADVRLRAGNYTVESDRPVVLNGKQYEWTQSVDIVAGREATLELTAANAEVTPVRPGTATPGSPVSDPYLVLPQWYDSVVAVWTDYTRASGFVVDARGLIATNSRVIGAATSVEVQLTPAIKVRGSVLASDPARKVAVLWVDPQTIARVRPVPLACGSSSKPQLAIGQDIFAIGIPLRQEKGIASGAISGLPPGAVLSDVRLQDGGEGGPAFTANGDLAGLTSAVDADAPSRGDTRIVPVDDACAVVAAAVKRMAGAAPPSATRLPVEPVGPVPMEDLKRVVQRRAGSLNPYLMTSSAFDVAFITPVHVYARYHAQHAQHALLDFGTWSAYVEDVPPVLLVRVTPKLVEGFWTKVARGAARTQGVAVPAIKRPDSSFGRLRAFCGGVEVTPVHPLRIERRLPGNKSIDEGLYAFDTGALGPDCGTVTLVLYSEKEPDKGDARVVDPSIVQQIWQDFAPFRGQQPH